jgi:3-oxoacyl-[acyl-carrier protein] reductase
MCPGALSSDGGRGANPPRANAVAIVTGGSFGTGRDVVRALARRGDAIVVVYLDDQGAAEATVEEILAANATAVAVRADLADELDVERLFIESIAAFGGVDVVVHTTMSSASVLYRHAVRYLRHGAAIVSVATAERITPDLAQQLHERGIVVDGAGDLIAFLDRWP